MYFHQINSHTHNQQDSVDIINMPNNLEAKLR